MKPVIRMMLLTSLATALAGCSDSNFSNNNNSNDDNSTGQVSYTVNLTAIEVVNTDTGAQVNVGGLPAEGDEIIKD